MQSNAFTLRAPDVQTTPVVFASPHSGRDYATYFGNRSVLSQEALRSSEDAFVDLLFDTVPAAGAMFLKAEAPRSFIDFNRAPDELDTALIEGLQGHHRGLRAASGLGVIPRVVAGGRQIYAEKVTQQEAYFRLSTLWKPYHDTLRQVMDKTREQFGIAILVDCHSMPQSALRKSDSVLVREADIVLGDRFGGSARPHIMDQAEAAFQQAGLRVTRNVPFAGAYITRTYGQPSRGLNCIQVEINRALYMDERKVEPRPDFDEFRRLIGGVARKLISMGEQYDILAAE